MAFSPPVVGCLVKKGLQKGGHRHPRTPLGYALAGAAYLGRLLIHWHFLLVVLSKFKVDQSKEYSFPTYKISIYSRVLFK